MNQMKNSDLGSNNLAIGAVKLYMLDTGNMLNDNEIRKPDVRNARISKPIVPISRKSDTTTRRNII